MNKKTSRLVVLASALAMCTFASMAIVHDGDRHGGELSQLNLTDAQRVSVQQIETTNAAQNEILRQAVQKQRQAFDAMTPNQAGYQTAAASLAQAEANETQARIMEHARVDEQIYTMLTPVQRTQLAQLKAAHAAREAQWEQFKAAHSEP